MTKTEFARLLADKLRMFAAHRALTANEARGALQCAQILDDGIAPDRITHPVLAKVRGELEAQGYTAEAR